MASSSFAPVLELRSLPPESWGSRLARAREVSGFKLTAVERLLRPHLSRSTLSELEQRTEVPTRAVDRGRVVLALVLYGVDPADFDLGPDDVPPAIDLKAVRALAERGSVSEESSCACTHLLEQLAA